MSKDLPIDLRDRIISCITDLQKMSGEEEVTITGATCPIKDLPNFDSLKGLVATVFIASRLDLEIPSEGEGTNIFVTEDGKRACSVNEVAKTVQKLALPS